MCRYGRKALQEMYQVFLRRRTPNATATPAWMEELLKDMPLEEQQQRRTELFDVSLSMIKAITHSHLCRHSHPCPCHAAVIT